MVATLVVTLMGAAFVSIMKFSGYSMLSISQRTAFNNSAKNATIHIIQCTRRSHTAGVTNQGNTLTLSFDDDSETDTDNDGDFYNDTDHQEIFHYAATTGNFPNDEGTLVEAETLSHQDSAAGTPSTLVTNTQTLGDAPIFEINATNPRQIDVNFELHNQIPGDVRTQRIDISTSAYRINGL